MNMTFRLLLICLVFPIAGFAQDVNPPGDGEKLVRLDTFTSGYVAPRPVDVWLPGPLTDTARYPVLYMHDGQMLFDKNSTWNKQAWDVDDVALNLIRTGKISKFIIVAIPNSGPSRHPEYFPQQPFSQLRPAEKDTLVAQLRRAGRTRDGFTPCSDDYLKFIVEELKPYIDSHFPTLPGREHTFISGSSMGGLISVYAICEYPEVFGGAACLSTHWPGSFTLKNNPFPGRMLKYLRKNLPDPATHKIYFDCGDQTLDSLYPGIQRRVDRIMTAKGFTAAQWMTKYFPGEDHSENAWNRRLHIPLEFLFGE